MVSQILTLLILAAATPAAPAGGASIEAVARATIVRGATLRPALVTLRTPDTPQAREVSRSCDAPESALRQCRLIVVDLP